VIEKFDPTNVLILSSTILEKESLTNKMGEEVVAAAALSERPRVVKAVARHHARYAESLKFLKKKTNVCIGIIPPVEIGLTMLTQGALLKKAVKKSVRRTLHLFGGESMKINLP
jgi:hypothetical protein